MTTPSVGKKRSSTRTVSSGVTIGTLAAVVTASRPFLVNVAGIRRSPGARRQEQRSGRIDGLRVSGSEVVGGEEVEIDVTLEVVVGGIVAIGTVAAQWVGECRRCLGPVRGRLAVEVRELYEPPVGPHQVTELIESEEETYSLHGDQLDLFPLARDAILLNLPLAPLCREDCAGLCPECGADRNEQACACAAAARDDRWAALDALDALRGRDPS
jgi:uncharacterized protein